METAKLNNISSHSVAHAFRAHTHALCHGRNGSDLGILLVLTPSSAAPLLAAKLVSPLILSVFSHYNLILSFTTSRLQIVNRCNVQCEASMKNTHSP